MSKCENCPVAAGATCYGETFSVRCDRAVYRAVYLRMSAEAVGLPEPAPADGLVEAIREFARLGGCRHKEPCGCLNAQCLRHGGDATPTRCVACIGAGENA